MARYNMARAKAEGACSWPSLDVPVVASRRAMEPLQRAPAGGESAGHHRCMRWAEAHPAVRVVLGSAPDVAYLGEWADELSDERSNERSSGETVTEGTSLRRRRDGEVAATASWCRQAPPSRRCFNIRSLRLNRLNVLTLVVCVT